MKKTIITLLIISIGSNIFLFSNHFKASGQSLFARTRTKAPYNLPLLESASCNFEKDMSVMYKDEKINYTLNTNKEPINISFINLNTKEPTMRGNAGQSDLLKIVDTDEVFTVVETTPLLNGTLQSFTIFKKTGLGIWSKQYDLLGKPFGLISMGYCD